MIHATPPSPCPAALNKPSEQVTVTGTFRYDGKTYRIYAITVGNCRFVLHVGRPCTSSATYSPKLGVRKTAITCK